MLTNMRALFTHSSYASVVRRRRVSASVTSQRATKMIKQGWTEDGTMTTAIIYISHIVLLLVRHVFL